MPLSDAARDELRAAGARPRRALLSGVEALTATERRVARLAADGLSNLEVAEVLVVTPKTVEWHLRNVYAKLRISGRAALPAAMSSDGDPPTEVQIRRAAKGFPPAR